MTPPAVTPVSWLYDVDWASTEEKATVLDDAGALVDPDLRIDLLTGRRWGPLHGLQGLEVFGEAIEEDFVELEYHPREVDRASADQVILSVEVQARARTSGLELSADFSHEWTLRDGRATKIKALAG
jgi:ketosteroid isomerase-like protein